MNTLEMLQAIIGYYLVRGIKTSPIKGYLTSIRNGHNVRGMKCPALDQDIIRTILRGARNQESIKKQGTQAVVTLKTMQKLWTRLKASKLSLDTKRVLWAVFTLLFLG